MRIVYSINNRVLHTGMRTTADWVFGRPNVTPIRHNGVNARSLDRIKVLALDPKGELYVVQPLYYRVLHFPRVS